MKKKNSYIKKFSFNRMKRKIIICTLYSLKVEKWYIITTSPTNMPKF